MNKDKAIKLTVQILERERRKKRSAYEMYRQGFESQLPGYLRWKELDEVISILKAL